jgi:hypothetical protein
MNIFVNFTGSLEPTVDIILCLNVLHHVGDDFGDKNLSLSDAKNQIKRHLQQLARHGQQCFFQLGFNWQGSVEQPLFPDGSKVELIDFVTEACKGFWDIKQVSIFDPKLDNYMLADAELLSRYDEIGEFLNRPIFLLDSLVYK